MSSTKKTILKPTSSRSTTAVVLPHPADADADSEDTKTQIESPKQISVDRTVLKSLLSKSGGKRGIVPITIALAFNATSAAATAQAPVVAVIPGSSSDFGSMSLLYDEFICDSVTFHWRLYNATTSQTSGFLAAVAYDPSNSGGYGSVAQVCEARQHFGPVGAPVGTGISMSPACVSKTGLWTVKFKMPKGPSVHDPAVASVVGTGNWTSTLPVTTTYGYLKFYVEAAGAGTTSLNGIMLMHCRFRSRT